MPRAKTDAGKLPDWAVEMDIDEGAVDRQREYGILPKLELPTYRDPPIVVTFAGEPIIKQNPKFKGGKAGFIEVFDEDGVRRQMNFSKTLGQACLVVGIKEFQGKRVRIIPSKLKGYTTKDGVYVEDGTTFTVQVVEETEAEASLGELRL